MWIIVKIFLFHIVLFRKSSRWHVRESLDSYGPKILRLPAERTSIHPPKHHTNSKLLRWQSPIIHTYEFTSGVKHSGCEVTSIHFLHKHGKFGHFQCFLKSCLQSGQIIVIQTIPKGILLNFWHLFWRKRYQFIFNWWWCFFNSGVWFRLWPFGSVKIKQNIVKGVYLFCTF